MDDKNTQNQQNNGGINSPDLLLLRTQTHKCKNCKQTVEAKGDVCPNCGHYLFENQIQYQPVSKKTALKIRLITGAILVAIFAALVIFGVMELDACSADSQSLSALKNALLQQ